MATRILIADDDPAQRRMLEDIVLRMGYRTILADGGVSALAMLGQRKDISLVLLDLSMSDMDGLAALVRLREAGVTAPVAVLVREDELRRVPQAIKLGAVEFLSKPLVPERVQVSIANVLKLDALTRELRRARSPLKEHLALADMVARSPEMERVMILARRAAALDAPLLIEGEEGAGKETLARAVCGAGSRWREAFVAVDCRLLTAETADEALFGRDRDVDPLRPAGKLGEARGATLFLDEVASLPRATQVRLFGWLQARDSDARVIAANSRPLADLVHRGGFHAGLYHLLGSFGIAVPPLRHRPEDVSPLLQHFVMRFAGEERLGHIRGVSPHAMQMLKTYDWPGNVRELKNAVYRGVLLCEGDELSAADFPQLRRMAAQPASLPAAQVAGAFSGVDSEGEVRTLAAAEEEMIRFAIAHYDGQISEVARRLGIGRTTLYRKLKEYGVDVASISGRGPEADEDGFSARFDDSASA